MKPQLTQLFQDKIFLLTFLVSVFLCFFMLGSKGIWFDEAFSVTVTKNFFSMVSILWSKEGNMWLYLLFLNFWQNFGSSEFVIRSLSAVFALATLPVMYVLGLSIYSKFVARIATIFLACSFLFIYFAQFGRGYTLFLFLTSLSTLLFIKTTQKKSGIFFLLYTLVSVLSIYTHILAMLTLIAQLLSLFFLPLKKILIEKLILNYVLIGIATFPLLLAPSFRIGQIAWLAQPELKNLLGPFLLYASDFIPLLFFEFLLFGVGIFYGIMEKVVLERNFQTWKFFLLLLVLLFPIISSFVFSVFVKPIYLSIYFVSGLVPYLLLLSASIEKLPKKILRYTVIFVIIFLSFLRLYGWYTESTFLKTVIENRSENWREAVNFVVQNGTAEDKVIYFPYASYITYEYYTKNKANTPRFVEIVSGSYLPGGGDMLPDPNTRILKQASAKNKVFYVVSKGNITFLNRGKQHKEILTALKSTAKLIRIYNKNDISVYMFRSI